MQKEYDHMQGMHHYWISNEELRLMNGNVEYCIREDLEKKLDTLNNMKLQLKKKSMKSSVPFTKKVKRKLTNYVNVNIYYGNDGK